MLGMTRYTVTTARTRLGHGSVKPTSDRDALCNLVVALEALELPGACGQLVARAAVGGTVKRVVSPGQRAGRDLSSRRVRYGEEAEREQ